MKKLTLICMTSMLMMCGAQKAATPKFKAKRDDLLPDAGSIGRS